MTINKYSIQLQEIDYIDTDPTFYLEFRMFQQGSGLNINQFDRSPSVLTLSNSKGFMSTILKVAVAALNYLNPFNDQQIHRIHYHNPEGKKKVFTCLASKRAMHDYFSQVVKNRQGTNHRSLLWRNITLF